MDRRGELPLQVFIILLYYFFYIGACNSPDKLLTMKIQQSQEFVQEFYFLYPKSETVKVQTKKVKLYIYFDFLLGAGGGRGGGVGGESCGLRGRDGGKRIPPAPNV